MTQEKKLPRMSGDPRIEWRLWQMNLPLLQMYNMTAVEGAGNRELTLYVENGILAKPSGK